MAYLEVLNGAEVGQQVPISKEVFFLGRDQNNHLVLSDRTVSRKHAVINLVDGNYTVTDLESLRGVLVNGVKEKEVTIKEGDEITLGAIRIYFYTGSMEQKTRRRKKKKLFRLLFPLIIILAAGGAGLFYFFSSPKSSEAVLREHFERGIFLYNEKGNMAGAKAEWEKILEKDPKKKSIYTEKASQLLENIGK